MQRRHVLSTSSDGLIHEATPRWPLLANADQGESPTEHVLLHAAEKGHADLGWFKSYDSFHSVAITTSGTNGTEIRADESIATCRLAYVHLTAEVNSEVFLLDVG